ncbi:hypothetical protein P9597_29555 [Aneurinibacillus migulanus]|uniref:hypothetical protein n=1 Tax=Aneurinibacillus migulanus TaxID=47500 RepID=UPI002E20DA29|nr:hypothetical protein [Aneurinibacillus migulanus]
MFNHLSNAVFRLYQTENSKYKSSLFDLIDGDRETKQTKGLAYLFSLSPEFLIEFLFRNEMQEIIKKILRKNEFFQFLSCDFLKVDAEMISEGEEKIRRDITLNFYHKSKKVLVLIIEAKNIKLDINYNLEAQLQRYVDPKYFPYDEHVPKIAIALTKYKQSFKTEAFVSFTWVEMIKVLHQTLQLNLDSTKSLVLTDYYKFITGVDKGMHYYEKEILSVPAGKTFEEITKYHIHACPDTPSYNYRDPLFITFRQKGGGVMNKLYKIEDILILAPENLSVLKDISESDLLYKNRLLAYVEERKKGHGFKKNDTYRFYILSQNDHITLSHNPRPEKNNAGGWYYTLSEMLSGRQVVFTDSR